MFVRWTRATRGWTICIPRNLYFIQFSVYAFRFICIDLRTVLSSIAPGLAASWVRISCHKRLSKQLVISSWQVTVNVLLSLQFSWNNYRETTSMMMTGRPHSLFVCVRVVSISMPSEIMTELSMWGRADILFQCQMNRYDKQISGEMKWYFMWCRMIIWSNFHTMKTNSRSRFRPYDGCK